METHATTDVMLKFSVKTALVMLLSGNITPAEYEYTLQQVLKTGYDINNNNSKLLLYALARSNVDQVTILFSYGAQVAPTHETDVFTVSSLLVNSSRAYTSGIAKVMFDHIMASPHFEVISAYLRDHPTSIDVFNNLTSDDDKAALYIRVGKLPYQCCSPEVLEICAKAGLRGPPRKTAPLTASARLEILTKEHETLKEQLSAETAKLTETTAKLEKASGIIAKLTSIC